MTTKRGVLVVVIKMMDVVRADIKTFFTLAIVHTLRFIDFRWIGIVVV